ncbi:unnamed protein product [Clonostachys solani]|uniref:Copper acquisition factor BIM1-like domain-containing protein n=1 Tax=Clonostachys solani TaxID=160281 RepID=A0A9N9ZBF8_9HYPO|nr:unnamed protein product [Clonostachys solani]
MSPKSMWATLAISVALAAAAEWKDFGPAEFLWPTDRVWSAEQDNTAPCGSIASPNNTNRTEFPMTNGRVALVAQDESYNITLSISYSDDPKSNSDFTTLISPSKFKEMELGHTCVDVTDPPNSVTSGDYATLQMIYVSEFDHNENETFYACADIKFVEASAFKTTIPCFNATEDDDGNTTNEWTYHHTSTSASSAASSTSTSSSSQNSADGSNDGSSSGGGSGLSKGGIAGAVVGSVVGACLILAAALFLYRRSAQKNRVIRQQKFEQGLGKDSASTPSVGMNNLSK